MIVESSSSSSGSMSRLHPLLESKRKEERAGFQSRSMDEYSGKQLRRDLVKVRKICVDLDDRRDINANPLTGRFLYKEEEEENDGDDASDIKMDIEQVPDLVIDCEKEMIDLLNYLRETHFYCVWCAVKYKNGEDLTKECPGIEKRLHETDL